LLSSHCPHPEISTNAYSNILVIAASLAVFSLALAKTIQPMPDSNILFTVYLLITNAAKIQIQHGWEMSLKAL
jgi:hypothetical protein